MRYHLRGAVLPGDVERDVFVTDDGRFTFDTNAPGADDAPTISDGGFLLPGLVDAHAHLSVSEREPPADPPATARANARLHLDAGVLAIREPGAPRPGAAGIGPAEGLPRVMSAGRFISSPGRYFPGAAVEVRPEELAGAAVAELSAGGGTWAKVIGDWVDPDDARWRPTFPAAALAEAAAAVHAAGGRIAIHAADPGSIEAAVEAGFDSIEHGLHMTDEQLARMASRGIAFVPTAVIMRDHYAGLLEMFGSPPDEVERTARALARHAAVVRTAAEAGVRVLAGTDAGALIRHRTIATEIFALRATGLPGAVAVGAGSWDARAFFGLPCIEEGAPADVVAYARDPRDDPAALTEPQCIVLDGIRIDRA